MNQALEDLRRLLPADGEPAERFVSCDLSPTEIIALTGRGLSVTGELLDGVAHDLGRAKAPIRLFALFGRILVGLARLLTPGGIEGTIYRHWTAIAVLVDLLLFLLSTFVPSGLRLALVATGYTVAAIVVVETARFVAQRTKGMGPRRALYAFIGLGILFVAMYAAGDWIFGTLEAVKEPEKASKGFWVRFLSFGGPIAVYAFGAAVLGFVGLVWARIAFEARNSRDASVLRGIVWTVAPFVAPGGRRAAPRRRAGGGGEMGGLGGVRAVRPALGLGLGSLRAGRRAAARRSVAAGWFALAGVLRSLERPPPARTIRRLRDCIHGAT